MNIAIRPDSSDSTAHHYEPLGYEVERIGNVTVLMVEEMEEQEWNSLSERTASI